MPTIAAITPADGATGVLAEQSLQVQLQESGSTGVVETITADADFEAGTLAATEAIDDELVLETIWGDSVAIDMNGTSSDYGTLSDDASLDMAAGDFTWECWVKPDRVSGTLNPIYAQYTDASNWLMLYIETDGTARLVMRTGGTYRVYLTSSVALAAGEVYHLAFVADRDSSANSKVYVNGVEATDPTKTMSTTSVALASTPYIGKWAAGGPDYFDGILDELRIWKGVALSAVQIQAAMRGELTGSETYLSAYWKFEEGSGSTVEDSSPNSNTITLTGCTWTTLAWLEAGSAYDTAGTWVSPAIDLTAVGLAGGVRKIEWDETLPSGATLAVYTSLTSDAGPWDACSNGGDITGISETDDLTGVDIWVKAALATTDDQVTPHLEEIRLVFAPMDPADVEVEVNGVAYTVANGGLVYWNHTRISGGAIVNQYDDLTFETTAALRWFDGSAKEITVSVSYDGVEIDSTTFTTDFAESFWTSADAYWSAWITSPEWKHGAGDAYYNVVDYAVEMAFGDAYYHVLAPARCNVDAYWWAAHRAIWDVPESEIVGSPYRHDVSESVVVRAWARADVSESCVGQCWYRADVQESAVAAIRFIFDDQHTEIVGAEIVDEVPESASVYGVNRRNTVEAHVISVETAAFLAELGVTFE